MVRRSRPAWCAAILVWGLAAQVSSNLEDLSRRAREAMVARRYEDAIRLYEAMAKALPGESGPRFNLAVALHSAGRYREAARQFEQIRSAQAQNANYWFLLGLDYLKLDQAGKAVAPLERAVKLDGSNAMARLELADAYLESGDYAAAEHAFRQLADAQPESARRLLRWSLRA